MAITHYEILGVGQNATRAEITAAFRAQMRALHADAGGDDELAKSVSSAYNVLSNATKRAAYDRTLGQPQASSPAPGHATPDGESRQAARTERNRVFTPEDGGRGASFSMLSVDPSAWAWHVAPGSEDDAAETAGTGLRSVLRTVLTVLFFLAWAGAGAAAASTLGLPLARIGALSVPLALLSGFIIHLVWSALMVTLAVLHRWGLVFSLLLVLAAAVVIYLDAGTPLPMIGAGLCYLASMATTYASFGALLTRAGSREGNGVIDSSFITQVGATTLGDRHADIDRLLGALKLAFGHRTGARVILLPDRVTPRPGSSPVRAQVAVVVGKTLHLIAIPPLGRDGLEISGSDVISDGQVHRNVVRDEVAALAERFGRGSQVRGYVVPTRLTTEPPADTQAHGVVFGSLGQVIDAIGSAAGADLDKEDALSRHRALESMSLLV